MKPPTEPSVINLPVKDDPWIRDVQAAQIAFLWESVEKVAQLCEGERVHCEFCGAPFPLWPIQLWAEHCLAQHAAILTFQNQQVLLAFCTAGLTDAAKHFLTMQMVARTTLRRRARDLGMTRFVDENGQLVKEAPRRILQ
jgi:hypothetical protein